uniref:Angiogenic factor with G patch and FHA domains 1 n=1 Tax=Neogobius melanostomus TaxID=47308 RepID=A0A8C6UFL6_9GOBI
TFTQSERQRAFDPGDNGAADPVCEARNTDSEMAELRQRAQSLKWELEECKAELTKLQKQLSHSERLQRSTESYNEDLRKQVEQLSAELHDRKRKDKVKSDAETQTEEYEWTDTDYYNYYYGGYNQDQAAAAAGGRLRLLRLRGVLNSLLHLRLWRETQRWDSKRVCFQEAEGSISDMLRATAEQALNQTGFVFDESTGMYYDHSTGFYYDSMNQLYYDNNTGIYYYYDAESGKYQFHSRIEVQTETPASERSYSDWKSWKLKKLMSDLKSELKKKPPDDKTMKDEKVTSRKQQEPRKPRSKSCSRSRSPSRRRREERRRRTRSRSRSRSRSSRRRRRRIRREERRRRRTRRDERSNSEPEEGELSSESERESTASSKGSEEKGDKGEDEETLEEVEMEVDAQGAWPPCVRVTVVRSPVLQVGTLFILTADCTATIGREKDMNHAIRIAEMGVSKFHAEVHFDAQQQCYVLVDQGSQNGTVINGNRILQPKALSPPVALTHGDEVKMGDTVLSFHIHPGTDTCDGCEPGQILAHLAKHPRELPEAGPAPTVSREDKEALRVKELKNMKAKYGLQSGDEVKALKNPRYRDRAESRRQTVGSQGAFQRDDAPASVHEEISEGNKGRKMLEKMGWKKGSGLGKEGTGIRDPIELKVRKAQSGLGAVAAVALDDPSLSKTRSQLNWDKARERFNDTCLPRAALPPAGGGEATAATWVRAEEPQGAPES